MPADLILAPEAAQDLSEAYDWYESHRAGLGEEFLRCVEARIETILRHPRSCPFVHQTYRRGLVRRFPYGVFYEHRGTRVTVYAVFHASRDPRKWRERLGE